MKRCVLAGFVSAFMLQAQSPDGLSGYLDALARTAATFAATAPGLTATETLDQRGRSGFIEVLRGNKDKIRKFDVSLARDFRTHHVVSSYLLLQIGENKALHEYRIIMMMDGRKISDADEVRHTLTAGLQSGDDGIKYRMLEELERNQLEGAATDFGPVVLLFQRRLQKDYRFSAAVRQRPGEEPVAVLDYSQISGSQGLTVFRDKSMNREPASGEILFRQADLLPIRITMNTAEKLSKKYTIRTEAEVDYTPSPFGLVPQSIIHRQFLTSGAADDDLIVENDFHYSDFNHMHLRLP